MARCGNPGASMNVHSDIALAGSQRLARVDSHPRSNQARGQSALPVCCSRDRVPCLGERDEERVTLRIHLGAAVIGECLPKHSAMVR